MKLTNNHNEFIAKNKALILYIIDKVGKPLSQEEFTKLVLSTTDINYFYFQQFLLTLIQNNYISNYEFESESMYAITEEGKEVLNLTKNIIPGILKLKVDSLFKEELNKIKEEFSITAEFIPESEKEYTVKCKLIENNHTIFEISSYVGSREQAKLIADNWKKNAQEIYPEILNILTK